MLARSHTGVIAEQSGKVLRETQFGQSEVCSVVLRTGTTSIRCAFWGLYAEPLSKWPVDSAIALYQANVVQGMVRGEMSWEIRATEATVVAACPDALAEGLRLSIAQQGDAPVVALTVDAAGNDYDLSLIHI